MQNYLKTRTILSYDDVVPFEAGKSAEPLVDARTYDQTIITQYLKEDMLEITGDIIFVRDSLARKLALANQVLSEKSLLLKVVYGYRHPKVQNEYFMKRKAALREQYPSMDIKQLNRLTHAFVADPSVAGHPAAAAIDVTMVNSDTAQDVDMGTTIADYADPLLIQTFDARVSETAMKNRMILHDAMVAEGFAPFYGEWWHFSYGDREWAAFYDKKALFGAIEWRKEA